MQRDFFKTAAKNVIDHNGYPHTLQEKTHPVIHVFKYLGKTLMEAKIIHTHTHTKHTYKTSTLFQNKLHIRSKYFCLDPGPTRVEMG